MQTQSDEQQSNDVFAQVPNLEYLRGFTGSIPSHMLSNTLGSLTQAGVTNILKLCEAFWMHSGDPAAPHAELTSGKCSDGFVDVLRALSYTSVCDILAYHMVHAIDKKRGEIGDYTPINWVIGSDHAGAVFSQNVARWFNARHDFTAKGPDKQQIWKRLAIQPGEGVLQMEELMTTTLTTMAVRDGIRAGNPYPVTFVPVVGTIVHRSSIYEVEGDPVAYLAHYNIQTWEPKDCPLCAKGSKRIRPKENWTELTGK